MRDGVGVGAAGRTHELEADAPGRPLHHGHAAGARAGSRGGERPRGHRQPRHRSPSHRRNRIRPQPLLLLLLFTESHRSSMQNYAMQCNKIGLKRWLKLVGWIGMLIMVAPRPCSCSCSARGFLMAGWRYTYSVFFPHSHSQTHRKGKAASLVRQAHSTGQTSYFEAL